MCFLFFLVLVFCCFILAFWHCGLLSLCFLGVWDYHLTFSNLAPLDISWVFVDFVLFLYSSPPYAIHYMCVPDHSWENVSLAPCLSSHIWTCVSRLICWWWIYAVDLIFLVIFYECVLISLCDKFPTNPPHGKLRACRTVDPAWSIRHLIDLALCLSDSFLILSSSDSVSFYSSRLLDGIPNISSKLGRVYVTAFLCFSCNRFLSLTSTTVI